VPDRKGPTGGDIVINGSKRLTTSLTVAIKITPRPKDPSTVTHMSVSNKSTSRGTKVKIDYDFKHKLSGSTAGKRTVYVWFYDRKGNRSGPVTDSITFDNKPVAIGGWDFDRTDDCASIAAYGYVLLPILPWLASDKDPNDSLKVVRVWNGSNEFPIVSNGTTAKIYLNPKSNFAKKTFTDNFTVQDEYGQKDSATFNLIVGPCP
jgi:hypothetical protein